MRLVIVESPAKAKTIEKFLGSGYKVVASYGHVRDLPGSASEIPVEIRGEKWARLAVDTENDFKPVYIVPAKSKKHIAELQKLVKQADELLLATDEDREGESISWHLLEVLKPKIPVKRIAFHEITRTAINQALAEPREVDTQLVRAQESRRILDRLYGYSLSPVLWKKVRTKLSAGRVQSVALRLIVEREEERQAFKIAEYCDVEAELKAGDIEFTATLTQIGEQKLATGKDFDGTTGKLKANSKVMLLDKTRAEQVATDSIKNLPWVVGSVERKQTHQSPGPPLTTSTLQQAGSSILGMSPNQTMKMAQGLYEGVDLGAGEREGLITYMRTDSVTLSEKALNEAADFISKSFGKDYYDGKRYYKNKSKSAQEAHEAIRPTDIHRTPESVAKFLDKKELELYRLIWNRTVASQMTDAVLDKTSVDLIAKINGTDHLFRANGSVIRFPGYLKVYGNGNKDSVLPDIKEGQLIGDKGSASAVAVSAALPKVHMTTPPARFTEASLVKRLEDEGIGRPSTYAPTISTIQQREYVVKRNGALIPTYVGMAVVHLLRSHFDHYIDLKFTARMEESLDEIAEGTVEWVAFLSKFYKGNGNPEEGLISVIKKELPNIEFPAIAIGNDPQSKQPMIVRIGRNSAYIQRGEGGEGNSATIPVDLLIDELSAEKAHELLGAQSRGKEPLGVDPATEKNVYALLGPYGPYVQLGEADKENKPKRVSLPKGMKLQDVDFPYAMKLLTLPRTVGVDPQSGLPVIAGVGRFGPYVQRDGVYKSLSSAEALFTVTLEQAVELLATVKKRTKDVLKELGAHPESGKKIEIVNGRYGPYVTDGKLNATVPKGDDPLLVTMEQAVSLLQATADKSGKGKPKRAAKAPAGSEEKAAKPAKKPAKPKTAAKTKPATKPAAKSRKVATPKKSTTPKKLTPSRIVAKSNR